MKVFFRRLFFLFMFLQLSLAGINCDSFPVKLTRETTKQTNKKVVENKKVLVEGGQNSTSIKKESKETLSTESAPVKESVGLASQEAKAKAAKKDKILTAFFDKSATKNRMPGKKSADEYFRIGSDLILKGDRSEKSLREALNNFTLAASSDPDFKGVQLNIGLVYYYLGEFDLAIKQFKLIGEKFSGEFKNEGLYNLGVSYMAQKKYDEAITVFRGLKEKNNYQAVINLGDIYLIEKKDHLAEAEFVAATEISPDRYEGYLRLGNLYLARGKGYLAIARENFLKTISLQPEETGAYFNLGIIYYMEGDLGSSTNMFSKVTLLEPEFAPAYYNLGMVHYQKHDKKNAIMYLTLGKRYKYPDAMIALAKIWLDENKIENAISTINQLLEITPENSDAYYCLGVAYQKAERKEEAIAAYVKALSIKSDNVAALTNLAVLYRMAGEFDKAIDTNYKITKIDPENRIAHKNLGIIFDLYLNNYNVAKYHYSEYLRLVPDKRDDVAIWLKEIDKRKEAQ